MTPHLQSQPGYGPVCYTIQKALWMLCLGSHQLLKELLQKAAPSHKTETVMLRSGGKSALHKPHCFCITACGSLVFFWGFHGSRRVERSTLLVSLACWKHLPQHHCTSVMLTIYWGYLWGSAAHGVNRTRLGLAAQCSQGREFCVGWLVCWGTQTIFEGAIHLSSSQTQKVLLLFSKTPFLPKLHPAPDTEAGNTGSVCEYRSSSLSFSLENRHQILFPITNPCLSISKHLLV